jgi:hypothetical protein
MPGEAPKPEAEKSESQQKIDAAKGMLNTLTEAMKGITWAEQLGVKPSEPAPVIVRRLAELAGIYPLPNLAVDVCVDQWEKTTTEQRKKGVQLAEAVKAGKAAFCFHLPKLSSRDEVSEFIACVAYGMANGIIPGQEGTRLLYAAQVAHSTLPSPKRRKKVRKTSQKQQSEPTLTPTEATT